MAHGTRKSDRAVGKAGRGALPDHVLLRTKSAINDADILVVLYAFNGATNQKTGRVIEVAFLLADVKPSEAAAGGLDHAICGDCPGRMTNWGFCYRAPGHDIDKTWKATLGLHAVDIGQACRYVRDSGLPIRFGSYGDGGVVSFEIIEALAEAARGPNGEPRHTGFTHQWSEPNFDPRLFRYLEASVEFPQEYDEMKRLFPGVKTHRLVTSPSDILAGEAPCMGGPKKEDNHCCTCLSCGGMATANAPDRVAVVDAKVKTKAKLKALKKYLANPHKNIRHVHVRVLAGLRAGRDWR